MLHRVWLLLLCSIIPAVLASPLEDKAALLTIVTSLLLVTDPAALGVHVEEPSFPVNKLPPVKRKRKYVHDIFRELSPYYQRRAYCMQEESFWKLLQLIRPRLRGGKLKKKEGSRKRGENNGAVNGVISPSARLSMALRYFAGGDPLDTSLVHGVGNSDVYNSVWYIVHAVNKCPELQIAFPSNHEEQKRIARGFYKRSMAGFTCCAGAIDGMLIWIQQPNLRECKVDGCGQMKFFCERKHKFGLNLQGTCDSEGGFLDIEIAHPGSTSDYLAFATSDLKHQLEEPGFLAPELCLFGDNAYSNRSYMATPYKSVKNGEQG